MVVPRPERDRGGQRPVFEYRPPLDTAPGGGVGAADGAVGALDERTDRRSRQEQAPAIAKAVPAMIVPVRPIRVPTTSSSPVPT